MSIELFGVFVLTMRDETRMASIERQLSRLDISFEYIDATVLERIEHADLPIEREAIQARYGRMLTQGEVSCFLSHRRIWQQVVEAGKPGVIFEDDALIEDELCQFLALRRWVWNSPPELGQNMTSTAAGGMTWTAPRF